MLRKVIVRCLNTKTVSSSSRSIHQTSRCLGQFERQPTDPTPHVQAPYSYAYGRSNEELQYRTIGQVLDQRVAEETGKPKVVSHYENIERTFTEFKEDVDRVARALLEDLGLKRGDVVGLWGCNSYDWITIQYACARVGVILCTINPYYQTGELMYALKKGDVRALFMPGSGSPQEVVNKFGKVLSEGLEHEKTIKVAEGEDQLLLEHIIAMDGEAYSSLPQTKVPIKVHRLDKLKEGKSSADLDTSITGLVSPDDPAIIMYTSGTTGKAKGAYLSHFTMLNNARLANIGFKREYDEISYCVPLPFFHSFAASFGCIAMTVSDFKLVTPCLRYNTAQVVEAVQKHRATHITVTPTLVIDLMNYVKRTGSGAEMPSLKCVRSGGAPMPIEVVKQFLSTVPSVTDFRIGYGSTELGPASTHSRSWYTLEQRIDTVGTPCDFVEIKIVDPVTRKITKLGEPGEICSRGYNNMIGYWKDPVKTAEVLDQAGWYYTGDLGTLNENGFLKVVGRTKEMIIVGGENVYPREIEELLHRFPGVGTASVIGVPDPRKGEVGCAWIKLVDKSTPVSEEDLKKFCKDNLSYFKVPQYFLFVDDFPSTTVGKPKKFLMRAISCEKLGLQENK